MHKKNKVYDKKGNKLTLIPVSTLPLWLFLGTVFDQHHGNKHTCQERQREMRCRRGESGV